MPFLFHVENNIPVAPWTETFTGLDGSLPNPDYWSSNGETGSYTIVNNKLRLIPSVTASKIITSVFILSGDFNVQVDWQIEGYSSNNAWAAAMQATIDGNNYVSIYKHATNTERRIISTVRAAGVSTNYFGTDTTHSSGQFRITRAGSVFVASYNVGSGWTQVSSRTIGPGNVRVSLQNSRWETNPIKWADFDNLTINSGTIIL